MNLFNRATFLAEKQLTPLLSGLEEFSGVPIQSLVLNREDRFGVNSQSKFLNASFYKSEKGGEMNTEFKSKFSKIHFSHDPSVFDI